MSFLSTSLQSCIVGTTFHVLQMKKYWVRQMEMSDARKCWPPGGPGSVSSVFSLQDAVSTDWSLQWRHGWPHRTLLGSEGKEHTCCSVLGPIPQTWACSEADQRMVRDLKAMPQVEWPKDLWGLTFGKGKAVGVCWLYSDISVFWCRKERLWTIKVMGDQVIRLKTDIS